MNFILLQIFEGVKPTLGELEKFEATPEEVEVEGKYTFTCTAHVHFVHYIHLYVHCITNYMYTCRLSIHCTIYMYMY